VDELVVVLGVRVGTELGALAEEVVGLGVVWLAVKVRSTQ